MRRTSTVSEPAARATSPATLRITSSSSENWPACTAKTPLCSSPRATSPISRPSSRSPGCCQVMRAGAQCDGRPAEHRRAPSVQRRKVWPTPSTRCRAVTYAAKTRNPLKFVGVPQTNDPISAISGPKFTILSGHVEEILLLKKLFFRLSILALIAKTWPDKVVRWCRNSDFLRPVFAASRVQRISDLRSKFALRPHHVPKYGKHPISDR